MFALVYVICMMGGNNCVSVTMPNEIDGVEICQQIGASNLKKQTTPGVGMVTDFICLKR